MERILIIIGQMSMGGAESFLMKMYRALDKNRYQFDFVIANDGFYCEEIRRLGGKIYYTTLKSKNLFKSMRQIEQIVKKNNYKSVIRFGTSNAAFFDLHAAKKGGAINLGVRTLSANQGGFIKHTISLLLRPLLNRIATIKFSPSLKAANATYGKRAKRVCVLNNGIDFQIFKYNETNRATVRSELGIKSNTIVFGHVGRLCKEKNHNFLLNVFAAHHATNPNCCLVCVGDGVLLKELKEKTKTIGIENNVIFLGNRSDTSKIYSAFDCFLFPSIFEGMPNALIEAQANGLPCLYSDRITSECELSNNIYRLKLDEKIWITQIDKIVLKRENNYATFKTNKYLIDDSIRVFIEKLTNTKY